MARRRLVLKLCIAAAPSVLILVALVLWFQLPPSPGPVGPELDGEPTVDRGTATGETGARAGVEFFGPSAGSDRGSANPRVDPTAVIRGIVLDPKRSPISGARVTATPRSVREVVPDQLSEAAGLRLARRAMTSRSDPDGRFEISRLLEGDYDLTVVANGFAPGRIDEVPTREQVLEIVLQPQRFLRGEVVDSDEKPIEDAEVRVIRIAADAGDVQSMLENSHRASADPDAVHRAQSDGEGRFSVGGLARGAYRVEVDRPGYLRATAPIVSVHESGEKKESYLVFQLEDGHEVRGIVRDERGEPIENARVRARYRGPTRPEPGAAADATNRPVETEERVIEPGSRPLRDGQAQSVGAWLEEIDSRSRRDRSIQTGGDGVFQFTSLPEGVYRLEVSSKSHRDTTVDGVVTDGEPVEIELGPGETVRGKVVDGASGDPVRGARVSHLYSVEESPSDDPSHHEALASPVETDATGSFEVRGLFGGRHIFLVEAEGYQTIETPPGAGDGKELNVALERTGSVGGQVRALPESPVEGLRVSLVRQDYSLRVGRGSYTDAEGLYRLFVPESGSYRVEVERSEPYLGACSRVIEVSDASAQIEGVDIQLELSATVTGVVTDQDLRPVAAARVKALVFDELGVDPRLLGPTLSGAQSSATVLTNAIGEFEAGGLRQGRYRLHVKSDGFISVWSESFQLASGGTHAIDVELEPEMTIVGTVFSVDGEAIPLAEIRAVVQGESDGEFWSEERTLSSTTGTFRLVKLANRPYDLRVTARDFASALLGGIPAGRDDVGVQLEYLVSVAGRVVGTFSEEPVRQYYLTLAFEGEERLSAEERSSVGKRREFAESDGAFSIDGLPPGRYLIEAESPEYLEPGSLEVEVPVDPKLGEVVIRMPERGLIGGLVLGGRGETVEGARVQALRGSADPVTGRMSYRPYAPGEQSGRSGGSGRGSRGSDTESEPEKTASGRTETRSDGTFFLRGLPDGIYRLGITHDDFVPHEIGDYRLENGTGGEATIGVRAFLNPGATLNGRVRGLPGAGAGAVTISLNPRRRGRRDAGAHLRMQRKTASVDANGNFEIRGLAVGGYTLHARFRRADGSSGLIRRSIEVHEPDREKRVTLELR